MNDALAVDRTIVLTGGEVRQEPRGAQVDSGDTGYDEDLETSCKFW
jgi:hypothetical protein